MDMLKCVYIVQVSMCGCSSVAVVSVSLFVQNFMAIHFMFGEILKHRDC